MTDETDTTSEVARVLGEHYDGAIRMDAWVCSKCGAALAMPTWTAMVEGTTGPLLRKAMAKHQADLLAEAGLLREVKWATGGPVTGTSQIVGLREGGCEYLVPRGGGVLPGALDHPVTDDELHARVLGIGPAAQHPQIATHAPAERTQTTSGGSGEAESANGSYTPAQHYADGVIHLDEPVSWEIGRSEP